MPIAVTPTPTQRFEEIGEEIPEPVTIQVWEASFSLLNQNDGISIDSGGDVDWEQVQMDNSAEMLVRSGNGEVLPSPDNNNVEDWYIQFNVDDSIIYEGEPTTRVVIEIEFLDEGTDNFNIQYDSTSGPFVDSVGVMKTDTGEIKTAVFSLCDTYFGNRDNGADFRISDNGDGAESIRRVTVRLIQAPEGVATINVDSCGADPFDDQPDSEAVQACVDQMCSGDTVVFTSPGGDGTYQGYLLDKTLFLMLTGAKSDLTFTSSDENDHALLMATADLKGYVVQLYSKAWIHNPGLIDNIKFQHLDLDGNREERLCVGPDGYEGGGDDNYGSWQPECVNTSEDAWDTDPWCSAGGLGMNGGFNPYDQFMDYESNPQYWSTGLEVSDVVISNVECGTGLAFSGAAGTISDVTIDTAGDHVHGQGCTSTDPDNEEYDWSDGMTLIGPAHLIENNTVINPSDIGIVHFGGRNMVIRNNTVIAEEGNYGAFGGIALHPWWFGVNGDYEISGNTVINNGDSTCGGIHAGINIGGEMWGMACARGGTAAVGNVDSCSPAPDPPGATFCGESQYCQIWAYVPEDTTFTLKDNTVTGAQINYLIGGIQFDGTFIEENNISIAPRDTDWEGAVGCWVGNIFRNWGVLDFVAFNPTVDGWTPLEVYCER
ncbi:MAG: hypothetical protein ACK2T7_07040 [Anaerolineales bacterium]